MVQSNIVGTQIPIFTRIFPLWFRIEHKGVSEVGEKEFKCLDKKDSSKRKSLGEFTSAKSKIIMKIF